MDEKTQTLRHTLDILLSLQPHATYDLSDKGFSKLFSELYGNCVKYNATAKEWYVWNGKVWVNDIGGLKTLHLAKDFSDALTVYCTTIKDERQRVEYQKITAMTLDYALIYSTEKYNELEGPEIPILWEKSMPISDDLILVKDGSFAGCLVEEERIYMYDY